MKQSILIIEVFLLILVIISVIACINTGMLPLSYNIGLAVFGGAFALFVGNEIKRGL